PYLEIIWRLPPRAARAFSVPRGSPAGLAVADARRGLVVQAAKAFAFSQHRQHVEDRGRGAAPGERGTQWLRGGTELDPPALGKGAHGLFGGLCAPGLAQL